MDKDRFMELCTDLKATLTRDEIEDGWFFCDCEWDGMLLHETDEEAELCGCRKNANP